MKGIRAYMKFNENKITIVLRDINGKRMIVEFDNEAAVLGYIAKGLLGEDDEILIVAQGGICLYSALCTDYPLNVDDLTGFFA